MRVPTVQDQETLPLPSAVFGTSPCAALGPDLYVTVIEHDEPAVVLTLAVAVRPGDTGLETRVKTTACAARAGVRAGVGAMVGRSVGLGVGGGVGDGVDGDARDGVCVPAGDA